MGEGFGMGVAVVERLESGWLPVGGALAPLFPGFLPRLRQAFTPTLNPSPIKGEGLFKALRQSKPQGCGLWRAIFCCRRTLRQSKPDWWVSEENLGYAAILLYTEDTPEGVWRKLMIKLKSLAFGLLAINVLNLPLLVSAVSGPVPEGKIPAKCACASTGPTEDASVAVQRALTGVRAPFGPTTPYCSTLPLENCTREDDYVWLVCIKTGSSPLTCKKFTHPVTVWFCPGTTYYKCAGNWSATDENCTPCTSGTSGTLPAGCTPPVPGDWTLCQ